MSISHDIPPARLAKLKGDRATLFNERRRLLDASALDDRPFTAAERQSFEQLGRELDAVGVQIAQVEAALDAERYGPAAGERASPLREARPVEGARTYRELFGHAARAPLSSDGFSDFGAFLHTVHSGLADPRLRAASGSTLTGSSGGFLVPEEHAATMLDKSLEGEIVRPRCDVQPMTSPTRKIAGFDALDNSSGALFGGFVGQWLAEGATATDQAATVRAIELTAKKLAIYAPQSNELIADAGGDFEATLGRALIGGLGWHLDYACLNGTGAGQPKGALNDAALITVTKDAGQAAATLSYSNLTKIFARMHPACVGNSVWVANPATIPQLLALTVTVRNAAGTENVGGSHIPVVSESNGQFTILTRPVVFSEKVPTLGAKGDIGLFDFSQYTLGLRKEISIERSVHVGWQTDSTGYRAILRADGMGRWSKPFTPRNGPTLSWCVTLEAR